MNDTDVSLVIFLIHISDRMTTDSKFCLYKYHYKPLVDPGRRHFYAVFGINFTKQECFLVGCGPPVYWPYSVVLGGECLPNLPDADPPACGPLGHVTCDACWKANHPPLPAGQNEWHTLVKILPCPKPRLRSVIIRAKCFKKVDVPAFGLNDPPSLPAM